MPQLTFIQLYSHEEFAVVIDTEEQAGEWHNLLEKDNNT